MTRFKIPFPVLYDTEVIEVCDDGRRELRNSAKGIYDYERNIFLVDERKANTIINHFPDDWSIITSVGYEIFPPTTGGRHG